MQRYSDAEPIILTNDNIQDILIESGIPEEITVKIEKSYTEEFGDIPPLVEHLIDTKILAANEQRKKEARLEKKVRVLEERLEKTKINSALDSEKESALESETDTILKTETDIMLETNSATKLESASDSNLELASDSELESTSDSELESTSDSNLDTASDSEIESEINTTPNYDIVLQVNPQKVTQIKSQIIDGKKYIVIPMEDDEQANVNGVNTLL